MRPKILVPFDFSASAEAAVAWAADLQRTAGTASIQMIHAINSHPPGTTIENPSYLIVPNKDEIAVLERTMREAAARHGGEATATVLIRAGAVGDIILDAAQGSRADLIVMGTHGRAGILRLILGSVAEHVLRQAECPVVTVRSRGETAGIA